MSTLRSFISLRSSASRSVVSTLAMSMARREGDVWRALKNEYGFLATHAAAVACVRNKDRGRSIESAYYRYAGHPTTMVQLHCGKRAGGASVILRAGASESTPRPYDPISLVRLLPNINTKASSSGSCEPCKVYRRQRRKTCDRKVAIY
jgi:hypothetical protein